MASGGDSMSEDYVLVGEDREGKLSTNTNHGDPDKQYPSDLQYERKVVEEIEVSRCQDENPSLQTLVPADQEKDTEIETESPESGAKDERNDVNGENPEPGETHEENPKRDNVGIFHTDQDMSWLVEYITKHCESCSIVTLTNNDSWMRTAERTSPHIICHSMRFPTQWSELERHLDYFIKSPAPLYFLITDVSDLESEEEITRWVNEKMPRMYELLILYEEEMDSIKPDRYKPWTDPTRDKLKGMRDMISRDVPKQRQKECHTVGIFSRSADEHYSWLQTLLRSQRFSHCVRDVRPCYISSSGYREFYQAVSRCSFGILYHTKNRGTINVTDVTNSLYDAELKYLSETLGKENVLVVIDDLDECGPEMKTRILQSQHSIGRLAGDLILFGNEEKSDWEKYLPLTRRVNQMKLQEKQRVIIGWLGNTDAQNTTKIKNVPKNTFQTSSSQYTQGKNSDTRTQPRARQNSQNERRGPETQAGQTPKDRTAEDERLRRTNLPKQAEKKSKEKYSLNQRKEDAAGSSAQRGGDQSSGYPILPAVHSRHRVGIFSRSAEEDYSWLKTLLGSDGFSHCVRDVRPCYISSSGYRQFFQHVSWCSFGILYHSKNRRRVNVTDVTDSLYDKELKYLSETLGKESVVVLIDDLEDSSSEVKVRILENQSSIRRLARNLILVNRREKQSGRLMLISPDEMFHRKV